MFADIWLLFFEINSANFMFSFQILWVILSVCAISEFLFFLLGLKLIWGVLCWKAIDHTGYRGAQLPHITRCISLESTKTFALSWSFWFEFGWFEQDPNVLLVLSLFLIIQKYLALAIDKDVLWRYFPMKLIVLMEYFQSFAHTL